ncbi:hypothetical protein EJV47_20210 [Hymenobacter gummosus]|uniref:Uncharacterized protein n=1 Tax=Hymenobacter gummosus TaxID=1776032 RepID=A0A3S0J7V5_9BACT|nr:hypothetical protein [Hymenobacter gummosus]RTQ47219.1 hypothetical protein EJV47_20210 [Hymenobacter gummosus]
MKTLCFSLLLAVLASAPFEGATAAPASATTLTTADHDTFGGGYKFKRKKRKKNRGPLRHSKRRGLFGR